MTKFYGNIKKTNEQFLKEVSDLYPNNEYIFLEKYKSNKEKLMVKHICGFEYSVTPKNFLTLGRKCPKCQKLVRKTKEYFLNELIEKYGDYTKIIDIYGDYKGYSYSFNCICKKCNVKFDRSPDNMLRQGIHCPFCSRKGRVSPSVSKIIELLNENNIEYILEKRFDNCRNKYTLPFDFYLPQYNFLIEYDGSHHERGWKGKSDSLYKIRKNDQIKNNFCNDNKIPLLRISYLDNCKDVINILIKTLTTFNDYSERKYTQASGNASYLLNKKDIDIVYSALKDAAVHKRTDQKVASLIEY